MEEFLNWLDDNARKIWLFIGAVLLGLTIGKPLVGSAVYLLGVAIMPKEG